jgi:NAD(P)H-nitrite reductase large subunit
MRIDRCVCFQARFEEMKAWADARPGCTFADVQGKFRCGTGCGLCAPYVRRALRTGQVVFHQIVTDRDEPTRPA